MEGIAIRRAIAADLPVVQKLSAALARDPTGAADTAADADWPNKRAGRSILASFLADPDKALWLAEADGQAIGFLRAGLAPQQYWRPGVIRAQAYSCYVLPEYRSQGVGSQLFAQFFAWAREQHAQIAMLSVYASNQRAIRMYKKINFRPEMLHMEAKL